MPAPDVTVDILSGRIELRCAGVILEALDADDARRIGVELIEKAALLDAARTGTSDPYLSADRLVPRNSGERA
ncbi:hypothetical protein [Salinarimonas soli]|uniref:Uncharacterized protein n=1 Tax=Salinarimonas soli TaxID=1638099 RepID=A0A5B2VHP2_9HYPH|nr:hypothetical protein [Salinarimonas soli]KAA2237707.1 hypothetical protein F0L46_08490 [Salinarimonas soli]